MGEIIYCFGIVLEIIIENTCRYNDELMRTCKYVQCVSILSICLCFYIFLFLYFYYSINIALNIKTLIKDLFNYAIKFV